MKGRKPKPAELRKREGNREHRAIPEVPKLPPVVGWDPPTWMRGRAAEEWRRIVPDLENAGLLARIDHATLEAYCSLYAKWRAAEGKATLTSTKTDKGYEIVNPFVGISLRYARELRTLAAEFGMSPSARTRVHVEPGDAGSEMDRLLSGPIGVVGGTTDSRPAGKRKKQAGEGTQATG